MAAKDTDDQKPADQDDETSLDMSQAAPNNRLINSMSAITWIAWIGTRSLPLPNCLPKLWPRPARYIWTISAD